MTGKEKCEKLRAIRRQIAKENNIPYIPEERDICTYKGDDCTGTCPKCEGEIRYLEEQLKKRAEAGMPVTVERVPRNQIPFERRTEGFSEERRPRSFFDDTHPEVAGMMDSPMDRERLRGAMEKKRDWQNEDMRIGKLKLPLLTKWKLTVKGGFRTVGQLTAYTPGRLEEMCGLSIRERCGVVDALREMGLHLKEERKRPEHMVLGMMKGPNDW